MKRGVIAAVLLGLSWLALPARAETNNPNTDWFSQARLGVFTHFLPSPESGPKQVEQFDVKALADQLGAMGAGYFVLTLGQNSGWLNSPNAAYERRTGYATGERCSKRDLPLELYPALKAKGIRLMLYLPCQVPNEDRRAQKAYGLAEGPKDQPLDLAFAVKWSEVIQEWSDRYGEKVAGWWFDGGYAHIGFDDAIAACYAAAAKHGNPKAIVTFNPGVKVIRWTKAEDYTAGELNEPLSIIPADRWLDGAQWHALTYVGDTWGRRNTRFADAQWIAWAQKVTAQGGVITLDMGPNYDAAKGPVGSLAEGQVKQVKAIGAALGRKTGSVAPSNRSREIQPAGRDSTALAAAIRQCRRGDTLRLPPGEFELTESLRLTSGVKLLGAGQDQTRLVYAGAKSAPFINLTDCEEVEVAHLTLDGRRRPLGQDGIFSSNSRRLFLHHLTIRDLARGESSFVHAIMFTGHNPTMERGITDSRISDCVIENIGLGAEFGGGIRMAWGSIRNCVERNMVRNTGRGGIFGDHSAELVIRRNQVSGSGGEGLGIEIWGGCPRSLIEDNVIDHWLSVDASNQTAVRRNIIGAEDDSLKFLGIEIIASDIVVTDNVLKRGARIGLSVSNIPKKNNVFWGYNTTRDCAEWGAQFQGESGGIAHHYFYRCDFEETIRDDPRAKYPQASGHGFRFNGDTRQLVFEDCAFRDNGGFGVQSGGANVDALTFLRCAFTGNQEGAVTGLSALQTVEFKGCTINGQAGDFPPTRAFGSPPPVADFAMPEVIRTGVPAQFNCASKPGAGEIVERLWDFNHGIAEVAANPKHTFDRPGNYRVTLIVWDAAGRGARAEKRIEVLAAK